MGERGGRRELGDGGGGGGVLVLPAVCFGAELEAEFLGEAAGLGHAVEVAG